MEKDLCYFTHEFCDIFAILDCFLSREYYENQHCTFMNIHNGMEVYLIVILMTIKSCKWLTQKETLHVLLLYCQLIEISLLMLHMN